MVSIDKSTDNYNIELKKLIEKEVEMGFYDLYLKGSDSVNSRSGDGCNRISYCSCDCDRCTCLLDWMH